MRGLGARQSFSVAKFSIYCHGSDNIQLGKQLPCLGKTFSQVPGNEYFSTSNIN